jgi:glycosyltransferase involved in cell wall biosynthesis
MQKNYLISKVMLNPRRPLAPRIDHDVAIIHFTCSWSKLPFLTLLRAQRARRPIIIVEHTYTQRFEEHCVPNPSRFRSMLRLCYGLADKVVAVSYGQAEWMLVAKLVCPERLVVIQQSVDCSKLMRMPLPQRQPGTPLRLAAYGRYSEQKGFDLLIQAMRCLPPDLATLSLGGYGDCKEDLKSAARNMPNINIGSIVTNLPLFLSDKDIVVIPSRWEAFGIVCLEARASARPLIVTQVDGLPEQISPRMGLSVAPNDPNKLAEAIKLAAQWDVTEMGRNARASIGNHEVRYAWLHGQLWNDVVEKARDTVIDKVA